MAKKYYIVGNPSELSSSCSEPDTLDSLKKDIEEDEFDVENGDIVYELVPRFKVQRTSFKLEEIN